MTIPRSLRRRIIVEFQNRCAYCHTLASITGARLVIDHIIPEAVGGKTEQDNLCLACHSCNEFKGTQTKAVDPLSGKSAPLFHPRDDGWREHFHWSEDGSQLVGLTSTGRATVSALNMNHPDIVEARRRWARVGWHPPQDDL